MPPLHGLPILKYVGKKNPNVSSKCACVSPFLLFKDMCLPITAPAQHPHAEAILESLVGEDSLCSLTMQGFCVPTKCWALLEVFQIH